MEPNEKVDPVKTPTPPAEVNLAQMKAMLSLLQELKEEVRSELRAEQAAGDDTREEDGEESGEEARPLTKRELRLRRAELIHEQRLRALELGQPLPDVGDIAQ